MSQTDRFSFKNHCNIGAAAAEDDDFLSTCYVDTGDLDILLNCEDRRRIVLGRTGAGKSALLSRLSKEANTIIVNPETLSFNYLANSTVLQFFLEAGVKLDLFFKLLWRHVFTVELLSHRYQLTSQTETASFFDRITRTFARDKHKQRAIAYLKQWGERFWEESEYRIKEITQKVENDLKSSIGSKLHMADIGVGYARKLSEEEKIEVVNRGMSVINAIQIRELTDVLTYLNEDVFTGEQGVYYVCIDKLDENWVDDRFRYLLIRSLIETIRDFLQVRHVKLVAALRTDLIERVFRLTRDPGFQEEKYRSLYLHLRWNEQQLSNLLDTRVNEMIRQTYTKKPVTFQQLLPAKVEGSPPLHYMIQRTLQRPRDLIEFFNTCIEQSTGRPSLTKETILKAEGIYSKNRLRSLGDEWINDYPSLVELAGILKQQPRSFKLDQIEQTGVEEFCLDYTTRSISRFEEARRSDILSIQARTVAEGKMAWSSFLYTLFHVFYLSGIVGLKTEAFQTYEWAHVGTSTITADTLSMKTGVRVHEMFVRALGIRPSVHATSMT